LNQRLTLSFRIVFRLFIGPQLVFRIVFLLLRLPFHGAFRFWGVLVPIFCFFLTRLFRLFFLNFHPHDHPLSSLTVNDQFGFDTDRYAVCGGFFFDIRLFFFAGNNFLLTPTSRIPSVVPDETTLFDPFFCSAVLLAISGSVSFPCCVPIYFTPLLLACLVRPPLPWYLLIGA